MELANGLFKCSFIQNVCEFSWFLYPNPFLRQFYLIAVIVTITESRSRRIELWDCLGDEFWPSLLYKHVIHKELKQRRCWATHVNWKWALFRFKMSWRKRIWTKCIKSHGDDLSEILGKAITQECKNINFRMTCDAWKRLKLPKREEPTVFPKTVP